MLFRSRQTPQSAGYAKAGTCSRVAPRTVRSYGGNPDIPLSAEPILRTLLQEVCRLDYRGCAYQGKHCKYHAQNRDRCFRNRLVRTARSSDGFGLPSLYFPTLDVPFVFCRTVQLTCGGRPLATLVRLFWAGRCQVQPKLGI